MPRSYLPRAGGQRIGRTPFRPTVKARQGTLRRPPEPDPASEWNLASIAEIAEWEFKPSCPIRDPPGILSPTEIKRLLTGLDPVATCVVVRLFATFWDWPADTHEPLRAFARASSRLLLAESQPTTVAARRRVHRARARVLQLGAMLNLPTADIRAVLAPM